MRQYSINDVDVKPVGEIFLGPSQGLDFSSSRRIFKNESVPIPEANRKEKIVSKKSTNPPSRIKKGLGRGHCGACIYWVGLGNGAWPGDEGIRGHCHRFPPVSDAHDLDGVFPKTSDQEECGEFYSRRNRKA